MTGFRKSVPKPTTVGAGAPTAKKAEVTVIYASDILSFPERDQNGVRLIGNIVLKPDAKMHTVYASPTSQKATFEIEGDEDQEGIKKVFEGMYPGDEIEAAEFVQNGLGEGFVIIYGAGCGKNKGKVLGSPCNTMRLRGGFEDSKDGTKYNLKFEQLIRDKYVPGVYQGTYQFAENHVSADASLDLTKANGSVYQLPSLEATASITASSIDLDHDAIVSLIGGGGSDPATLSSGVQGDVTVLLKDDTQWLGLKDSIINLAVFKAGATTYLREVSRV